MTDSIDRAGTQNPSDPILFSPFRAGKISLPNRIVMVPLTRCRTGEGAVPRPMAAVYYSQRASSGLIVSEATQVSPHGVGYPNTRGSTALPRW